MPASPKTLNNLWLPIITVAPQVLLPGEVLVVRLNRVELQHKVHRGQKIIVQQTQQLTTACLAQIVSRQQTDHDGNVVFVLKGMSRVQLLEVDQKTCRAKCDYQPDHYPEAQTCDRNIARKTILDILEQGISEGLRMLTEAGLKHELSLGALCDLATQTLQLTSSQRNNLLQESNVDARCATLLDYASGNTQQASTTVPMFSSN